jgi:hypothetical protein
MLVVSPFNANGYDFDAIDYINRVEFADGQPLELGTRWAFNRFIRDKKNDGDWDAIKACCIMAGARTLAGALTPLKGTSPTNFNFVAEDYNRKTGLVGDGTTKYLDSNRNNNTDPQDDFHAAVHVTQPHTAITNTTYIGVGIGVSGITHLGVGSGANSLFLRVRSAADTAFPNKAGTTGFIGVSRSQEASFDVRFEFQTTNVYRASEPSFSGNLLVFGRVVGSPYVNGRIAFYSIGQNLNLDLLDASITQLMTDINNAF